MRWVFLVCIVLYFGGRVVFAATIDRLDSIRQGQVWQRPAWIKSDFRFAEDFDVVDSFPIRAKERLFLSPSVDCEVTPRSLAHHVGGMTRKFYCEVAKPGGGTRTIKVKYPFSSGEVPSEVLGTRLLWALGFPADRMYLLAHLNCRGCTEDPFNDRRVDQSTLTAPRVFEWVAVEGQYAGHEIRAPEREGWSFRELMADLPEETGARDVALVQREALRLLVVFLRYADNKPDNQRLVCQGQVSGEGGCVGSTVLMLHDLGVAFGKGTLRPGHMSKAVYPDWAKSAIWKDPSHCVAELGENNVGQMEEPVIREEGRAFLVKLLRGFSRGPVGRRRVENLFRYAHAEWRMGTIRQWTETFLLKVDQLAHPLGPGHPEFRCPQ